MSKNDKKFDLKTNIYIIVIVFLCMILCIYDVRFIAPSIILCILVILYSVWFSDKRRSEIINHIQEVTTDVDNATKNNLINSPIPLLLIETDGTILWKSKSFIETFKDCDISTYLTPIIKEIKIATDDEKNANECVTKQISVNNKTYKILVGISNTKKRDRRKQKEYNLILYFVDETDYNELVKSSNDSKTCIGIAMIDNYEDIMQRAIPEERMEILASVEKTITDWAKDYNGVIFKTERDRYIYIFEQKFLTNIENDKFNILDKVKNINEKVNFKITLSLALSIDGENNFEKYRNALSAMDIVLGRGGDQAVVKKDGKFKFYGGNTIEVEKRTRVKARNIAETITGCIKDASNIIIMGHSNIDMDAIGAALGIYRLSKTFDKTAYIVSEPKGKSLTKFFDDLDKNEEYDDVFISENTCKNIIDENTLLIIVDTHKTNYVEFPDLLDKVSNKIIIDHHRKTTEAIEDVIISFHEVYASSTSELVTEIIQYAPEDVKLSLIEAESLYGGIMLDTKNFTFKTGVRTFEAAAYLRKYGVDIIRVQKWFQADLESYNVIADIVKNVEICNDNIAISIYDNEDDENANIICAQAADELLTISNITASFVLGKVGDKVFISGRSIGDINVQIILEKLGGGGHITLAGTQIEGISLEDARNELLIRINEYFTEIE